MFIKSNKSDFISLPLYPQLRLPADSDFQQQVYAS